MRVVRELGSLFGEMWHGTEGGARWPGPLGAVPPGWRMLWALMAVCFGAAFLLTGPSLGMSEPFPTVWGAVAGNFILTMMVGAVFTAVVLVVLGVPMLGFARPVVRWLRGRSAFRIGAASGVVALYLPLVIVWWVPASLHSLAGVGVDITWETKPAWLQSGVVAAAGSIYTLGAIVIASTIHAARAWIHARKVWERAHPEICGECGYDLRGLGGRANCPECGEEKEAGRDQPNKTGRDPTRRTLLIDRSGDRRRLETATVNGLRSGSTMKSAGLPVAPAGNWAGGARVSLEVPTPSQRLPREAWGGRGSVRLRTKMFRGVFHGGAALLMALGAVGGGATRAWAQADDNPVMLQWFETRWQTMERRVPDFFMAGYDGVWLPPPSRAGDSSSPGYDVFDRFDLGRPGNPTIYGTEEGFRAVLAELQRAGALVYVDSIFNHNSGRTSNAQFHAQGGWPGFVTNLPGDFWGDFHTGQFQSIDPGGPNYNLWEGDLVGLIDIAQEENLQYIRHPVDAANPLNIPPGTVRNRPDAANARFYPDLDLPPVSFVNPAQPGHPWTIYPFNTEDPYAGDPVADNATGLLMRWAQWMLDDVGVDGFRLDAAKHIPQWFWNQYFDTAVYQRRRTAWGALVTPLSFVESVDSNSFTQTYLRKDGFGFRDGLDLNGAGQLRDLLNAQGFGTWGNVLSSHLDNQDDGNGTNGSQGVMHVFSHDNGSAGDGGSAPPVPGVNRYALPEHAYLMFRPGLPIVYHNSREMIDLYSSRGFWPREGNPTALSVGGGGGGGAPDLVELVQIAGGYARGDYRGLNFTDTVNPSTNDVLVFERRTQVGPGVFAANVLVGMNDRYDAGFQQRSVQTSFAPGTRLRELTGNHADAMVDPAGGGDQVPQFLIVDANRRVLIRVPNNASSGGQHHKGYVVYGPAAPSGVVMIDGATGVVPPDGAGVPSYRRRLTAMEVVTTESFGLSLVTSQTDLLDPNTDDFAAFRIDEGFVDRNGNGEVDIGPESPTLPGFEQFVTFNSPLFGSGNANGAYYQTIDATVLEEGPHFVTVRAFRHRDDGGLPIYGEFRKVVYVDREPPAAALVEPGEGGFVGALSYEFAVRALDRTVDSVHILLNVPEGSDPVALCNAGSRATQTDRFEFRRTIGGLPIGASTVTMVAFEATGSHAIETVTFVVNIGTGDVNLDGEVGVEDLYDAFMLAGEGYLAPLDMDENGLIDVRDYRLLEAAIRSGELLDMTEGQR